MNPSTVTVIIPTMAASARQLSLFRAIEPIRQQDTPCRIIVVVDGDRRHTVNLEYVKHKSKQARPKDVAIDLGAFEQA